MSYGNFEKIHHKRRRRRYNNGAVNRYLACLVHNIPKAAASSGQRKLRSYQVTSSTKDLLHLGEQGIDIRAIVLMMTSLPRSRTSQLARCLAGHANAASVAGQVPTWGSGVTLSPVQFASTFPHVSVVCRPQLGASDIALCCPVLVLQVDQMFNLSKSSASSCFSWSLTY